MPDTPPKPLCPYCGSAMHEGIVEIEGTTMGFILHGSSQEHLWFRGRDTPRKKVLGSSESTFAHQCGSCGAVAIPPQKTFTEKLDRAADRISTFLKERKHARERSRKNQADKR